MGASQVAGLGTADLVLIAGQLYDDQLFWPLVAALRALCAVGCTVLLASSTDQWTLPNVNRFLNVVGPEAGLTLDEYFVCSERGYAYPSAALLCASLSHGLPE